MTTGAVRDADGNMLLATGSGCCSYQRFRARWRKSAGVLPRLWVGDLDCTGDAPVLVRGRVRFCELASLGRAQRWASATVGDPRTGSRPASPHGRSDGHARFLLGIGLGVGVGSLRPSSGWSLRWNGGALLAGGRTWRRWIPSILCAAGLPSASIKSWSNPNVGVLLVGLIGTLFQWHVLIAPIAPQRGADSLR